MKLKRAGTGSALVGLAVLMCAAAPAVAGEPVRVCPDHFSHFGTLVFGTVDDLCERDGHRVQIQALPPVTPVSPAISITVEGTAESDHVSELAFVWTGNNTAFPGVPQEIRLFNFDTHSFEVVDHRESEPFERTIDIVILEHPERYIEHGTGRMITRVLWLDPGMQTYPAWRSNIDEAAWIITP